MDVNCNLYVSFVGLFLLFIKAWKTLVLVSDELPVKRCVGIKMGQKENLKQIRLPPVAQKRLCLLRTVPPNTDVFLQRF